MNNSFKKLLVILRIVMPILFILIGLYCLVFPEKIQLEPQFARMFAYIVIAYGLLRGYRAYRSIKGDKPSGPL